MLSIEKSVYLTEISVKIYQSIIEIDMIEG